MKKKISPAPSASSPETTAPAKMTKTSKRRRRTRRTSFQVALQEAQERLQQALMERVEVSTRLTMLNAEIPQLQQVIGVLQGNQPSRTHEMVTAWGFPGQATDVIASPNLAIPPDIPLPANDLSGMGSRFVAPTAEPVNENAFLEAAEQTLKIG